MLNKNTKIRSVYTPSDMNAYSKLPEQMQREVIREQMKSGGLLAVGMGEKYDHYSFIGDAESVDSNFPLGMNSVTGGVPGYFLRTQGEGVVLGVTAPTVIAKMTGKIQAGRWEDDSFIQAFVERTGIPVEYGDYTAGSSSNILINWAVANTVRFEIDAQVGILEQGRISRTRIDLASEKRAACAMILNQAANTVGLYGYQKGANYTYGLLTAPNLNPYMAIPDNADGSKGLVNGDWADNIAQLLTMITELVTQSSLLINPYKTKMILAVPTSQWNFLYHTNSYNISVRRWLTDNFEAGIEVIGVIQLEGADAGDDAIYLYPEIVNSAGSTAVKNTFWNIVEAEFMGVGIHVQGKNTTEYYSNCIAGVMCPYPFAVVRGSVSNVPAPKSIVSK